MIKKGWTSGQRAPWRTGLLALSALSMVVPSLVAADTSAPPEIAAFDQVWQRADFPVAQGMAKRSWLWGPQALENRQEPLVESPGGMRQVRYYDKSRMEVNNPAGDPQSPWFVTNGLLVVEMISGHMQVGVNTFEPRDPAGVQVAGDVVLLGHQNFTPSYAALANVATIDTGQHRAQSRIGQVVNQALSADGTVTASNPPPTLQNVPTMQQYESVTGHNIPNVFWSYMNQRGTVYENGQYHAGQVFNWLYAMGYPITEPYWITVEIGGKKLPVMMQAFQRRILTYNPANAAEWQVEMGNVGMQYHQWRYGSAPVPQPSPTPSAQGTPLSFQHVEDAGSRQYSAIHDPLYSVITNQAAWAALWAKHSVVLNANSLPPVVDFKTQFVLAAFWGDKPDGCYSLNITGVKASGKMLTALMSRSQSDNVCPAVVTQPHDFAIVNRSSLEAAKYNVVFMDGDKVVETHPFTLP